MANPTPYSKAYSFSGHQAVNPEAPLPAPALDNELANIETTLGETVAGLADVRRSDGSLFNGSVGPDQLSSALTNNWKPRGAWSSASVSYHTGDGVFHEGYFYVCREAHTSSAGGEPGVATDLWLEQFALATAVGNMLVQVYDPDFKEADVYNVDNHDSGTTNKVFTAVEKTKLAGVEAAATASPYIPAGIIAEYAGATEPAGWLFCYGQAVSRTAYADLFTALSTLHGVGDGATTFNLPDRRGRVGAGRDDMGGTSANRLTGLSGGVDGDVLGATGGAQAHTLLTAQTPAHSHNAGTLVIGSGGTHSHNITTTGGGGGPNGLVGNSGGSAGTAVTLEAGGHTHAIFGSTGVIGSGSSHNNVQPTIVLNYIIKT